MTRIPARRGGGVCPAALALALIVSRDASAARPPADESALTVADLAAYRAALSDPGPGAGAGPPVPVGFRELWDHHATYQGRRVQVQGRLIRRFRQGAFGTFPPLEEAWVFSPAGDPFCLVFPASPAVAKMKTAASGEVPVRFTGTFLKLLRYEGGDGPRLAPLIVGPAPPVANPIPTAAASGRGPRPSRVADTHLTGLDWAIGIVLASTVALVLAVQHLRRPARPLDLDVAPGPAPLFDDAPTPPREG